MPTDDVNGIARGRVKENAGEGGFEDDYASTSVEEKFDGYAGVGDETESEEGWRTEERDDLAMDNVRRSWEARWTVRIVPSGQTINGWVQRTGMKP